MVIITEQITIKLNKEKFEKLLDDLMDYTGLPETRSELVGKALWFLHCFAFKKVPAFGNKTHFELMLKERGMNMEQFCLDVRKKYLKFTQTGKP